MKFPKKDILLYGIAVVWLAGIVLLVKQCPMRVP
jgi:hypothetical protein